LVTLATQSLKGYKQQIHEENAKKEEVEKRDRPYEVGFVESHFKQLRARLNSKGTKRARNNKPAGREGRKPTKMFHSSFFIELAAVTPHR
jgi:hypothetical protein